MSINFLPQRGAELKPRITVIGVGGAGGNAVNNMIQSQLEGVEFIVANTDAQAISTAKTDRRIQLGNTTTQGLGAGSRPDIGRAAAEESLEDILAQINGANMVFITAGMGGGTGSGAAPVIARAAREHGILTVGVVTKPFHFEGRHRMRTAEAAIEELQQYVDTLIIIPNQNLFRVASEKTTFADAFKMADDVLYSGVRGVTDLMIMPGLINLDFADIRTVMSEMGKAMMGTGEAEGEKRALDAAEAAISNPLLDDTSMKGARGVLINITGGHDMTLFEVDEAANRIRDEVDPDANIIFGSTFDEKLAGRMRVSVVATGIESEAAAQPKPVLVGGLAEQRRPTGFVPNVATERAAPMFRAAAAAIQPAPSFVAPQPALGLARAEAPAEPVAVAAPVPAIEDEEEPLLVGEPLPKVEEPEVTVRQAEFRIEQPRPMPPARPAAPAPREPRQAAPTAPAPQPEQRRAPTLFERVVGARRKADEPVAAAPKPAEPAPAARLSSPGERAAQPSREDDLLDIPAFLRRQAN
jgi:cell division protein FtsZ